MIRHTYKLLFLLILGISKLSAQQNRDSLQLDMMSVMGNALNGNIHAALQILNSSPDSLLVKRHALIKKEIKDRFAYAVDRSSYSLRHQSEIDPLLLIYKTYWRRNFLEYPQVNDAMLIRQLTGLFKIDTAQGFENKNIAGEIDLAMHAYVKTKGYYTIGFSKTGKYYDLQVWKTQQDTVYRIQLEDEYIDCPLVFITDFVTRGWQEYATADKIHPGGWATSDSLFCVRESYDLNSEKFNISFLHHEGRHFNDYKKFPGLSNPDLEYRAKLTELSLADAILFELIQFFISTSNPQSTDGHQLSNYYVIHDLSKALFHKEFETQIKTWENIGAEQIRKASAALLKDNSLYLNHNTQYITPVK